MVLGSGIIAIAIYIRLQRLRKYLFFEQISTYYGTNTSNNFNRTKSRNSLGAGGGGAVVSVAYQCNPFCLKKELFYTKFTKKNYITSLKTDL